MRKEQMMKSRFVALVLAVPLLLSCTSLSIFKKTISLKEVLIQKEEIDKSDNPAYKFLRIKDLSGKRVSVRGALVRDIIPSGNVDYEFCVIVRIPTEKGAVDCHVYSRDLDVIARLVSGTSRIDFTGDFGRFFTLLDDAYMKMELLNADVRITGGSK